MSDLEVDQPATAGDDPPPPLTVSGPAGRVAVELATGRHTIGELADVLGIPRGAVVVVDGQPVDRRVRLDRSGVANGSRVAGPTEPHHLPSGAQLRGVARRRPGGWTARRYRRGRT